MQAPGPFVCVWTGQAEEGVFKIPSIPVTENKRPIPDINQLFREEGEGLVLRVTHLSTLDVCGGGCKRQTKNLQGDGWALSSVLPR